MNILQMLPQLESGGVETGTIDLVKELNRRGHKAVVISSGGKLVKKLEELGVKHCRLDVDKKSLLSILRLIPEVSRIIRSENIDIVHARSRVPAWIGFFAARNSNVKFITTCHGYYNSHFSSRVMGWGKRVIVISQVIGRHMLEDFKVPKEKIRLIYRGVDLEKFVFRDFFVKKNTKEKVIGMVGRITPLKGHSYFLKSLPGVISEIPDLKILIAGDAPLEKHKFKGELIELTEQLNLKQKVEFLGDVKNIPALLKKLDLLVLATTTPEAFGRVIIEAGAVGVPIVATRVGGVIEVIEHEKDGLLAEPANPPELAAAIVRLLKDEQLAENLARNLRKKTEEEFSLDTLVNKTIAVYEEVLREKKILIVKFGALGDMVLITPALRALRQKFPEAVIEVLIKKEYKDILQACPYIDELIILKNENLIEIIKKIYFLRKKEIDLVIDLQNNKLSHLIGFFAGIRERFGYKNKKLGFLLNRGITDKKNGVDPVTHQFRVLEGVGIELKNKNLELWVNGRDEENADNFLAQNWVGSDQLLIGINATASRRWQTKLWSLDKYAHLADILAQRLNARIVFTGTVSDRENVEKIISSTHCRPINACGKTSIMQLVALIKRCSVFLTTDSAPLHIAAAVNTPFVVLFGPTDPARHLPSAKKFVLIKKDLRCSPCYRPACFRKACMNAITAEEVFQAIEKMIKTENLKKK